MSMFLNTVSSPTTSNFSVVGQTITVVFVLIFTIGVIYLFAFIANKLKISGGVMQNNNITLLEYKNIGHNNNLVLVKAGDKYVLLSSSKERVTFISEVNGDSLNLEQTKNSIGNIKSMNFKEIFESKFKHEDKQNFEFENKNDTENGGK